MAASVIKSIRGGDLLVLNKFTYFKEKELKSGEIFWRCNKRHLKCEAKVFTLGPELTISRSNLVHNHEPNEQKLNRKVISSLCKRKAEEDIAERPSKIVRTVLSENLPETITTNDVNLIRKNMYYCRRKIFPGPLPNNISDVHATIDAYATQILTSKGENFLFFNCLEQNIIVFTCKANIHLLSKINIFYMDGTFSYCTKFFYQLFTIHGLENGHYVPLIYSLLPNKNTNTYINLFGLIKSKIFEIYNISFEPKEVFVDFEKAIHNGIAHIWPNTKVYGCRFHLHQAWYRKIQALGLVAEYKNKDSQVGKWLRYTFGLTYLKPEEVSECFVFDMMSVKPEVNPDDELSKYADYLLETYIEENAIFPPEIWAEESASITRTTNTCESFHSKFNDSFYSTHPSIYVFIQKLKEIQVDTYVKIQSLSIPPTVKDRNVKNKLKAIQSFLEMFRTGRMSRFEFVKCVSYYH